MAAAKVVGSTSLLPSKVVARTRLVTRDSLASSVPTAARVTAQVVNFVEKLQHRDDEEAWSAELAVLEKELDKYEFMVRKCDIVTQRCQRESQEYSDVHAEIDRNIQTTTASISELQAELEEQKRIRANREQYEVLAKVINEHPARSETLARIAELDSELSDLQHQNDATDRTLELRKKQFQLLMHTVWDLQQSLEEDEDVAAMDLGSDSGEEEGAMVDVDTQHADGPAQATASDVVANGETSAAPCGDAGDDVVMTKKEDK